MALASHVIVRVAQRVYIVTEQAAEISEDMAGRGRVSDMPGWIVYNPWRLVSSLAVVRDSSPVGGMARWNYVVPARYYEQSLHYAPFNSMRVTEWFLRDKILRDRF